MKLQKTILMILLLVFGFTASASATELAEDFTFKDIKGNTHKLSDFKGKWVLANYWGTYCSPCLEEIPDLIKFTDKHKKDVVVLGLETGGTDLKDLIEFADDYDMNYIVAPVQESTINAFGILMVIPTTYVISPKGEVVDKILGVVDLDSIETQIALYNNDNIKNNSPKKDDAPKKDEGPDGILDF